MIHDIPTVFSGCQQRSRVAHLEKKESFSEMKMARALMTIFCLLFELQKLKASEKWKNIKNVTGEDKVLCYCCIFFFLSYSSVHKMGYLQIASIL